MPEVLASALQWVLGKLRPPLQWVFWEGSCCPVLQRFVDFYRARRRSRCATRCFSEALERRWLLTNVTAVTPYNGAQNVAGGSNITVTFGQAMNASTINSSTIQLRDPSNNVLPASVSFNSSNNTATLDPNSNLANTS